jgi:hypothetical protein
MAPDIQSLPLDDRHDRRRDPAVDERPELDEDRTMGRRRSQMDGRIAHAHDRTGGCDNASMRRHPPRLLVLALGIAAGGLPSATSAASRPSKPTSPPKPKSDTAKARLEGPFLLAGRVTVAKLIPGERVGQTVTRNWTFAPQCKVGACGTVVLTRERTHGTDRLMLHRKKPGYYVGSSRFFAPLRCGNQVYPRGAAVPFTITVTVMHAITTPSGPVANRVNATYLNRSRINRTPCVGVLGHDAANYHGHLMLGPPPPTGGAGA